MGKREDGRWEGKAEILKVESRNGEHRTSNEERGADEPRKTRIFLTAKEHRVF
jgi:hypothetical protein